MSPKYIVTFDSADPYICSTGCYLFDNDEELVDYYNNLYESTDRIFVIKEEFIPKKLNF